MLNVYDHLGQQLLQVSITQRIFRADDTLWWDQEDVCCNHTGHCNFQLFEMQHQSSASQLHDPLTEWEQGNNGSRRNRPGMLCQITNIPDAEDHTL